MVPNHHALGGSPVKILNQKPKKELERFVNKKDCVPRRKLASLFQSEESENKMLQETKDSVQNRSTKKLNWGKFE